MRDKVIVITGASSGIGAALAELLAARGAKLMLVARREPALKEVAARANGAAISVADVGKRADVERVVSETLAKHGQIDVWVSNAGQGISVPVSRLTDEDVDEMVRINCKSALYAMQAVLPHFKQRKRGHIINVSTMLARLPMAHLRSAYAAAKAALNILTASLRIELMHEFPDIHVSTVTPGVVATEFGVHARGGGIDNRQIPGAQPVAEVAQVIAGVIDNPRADVYTRPEYRDRVVAYYTAEDMAEAEKRMMGPIR